ncbi:Golgi apparatus membrane protein TVP38 [Hysterangium stoloniferum]|nr:Golgi apparatus membrane protein TVP38 [Hysterangium stoloniferum]
MGQLRRLAQEGKRYFTSIPSRYQRLNFIGKSFVWFLVLFHIALFAILALFGPTRIFQWVYDMSQELKNMRFGWLILTIIMVVASFPPMVGYSTCVSICGFAYGMQGYYVAGPATLIGSGLAFIVLRLLFMERIMAWSLKNEKWQALEEIIQANGLPLIILIRLSPFPPYVYSQALFASISVVKFWQFMLATICYQPRILLAVFIGSKVGTLSDGRQRGEMDTTTKILNSVSIVAGILLSLGIGWFLYQTVLKKVRALKESPERVATLAAAALEEVEEGAPLLRSVSSDNLQDS